MRNCESLGETRVRSRVWGRKEVILEYVCEFWCWGRRRHQDVNNAQYPTRCRCRFSYRWCWFDSILISNLDLHPFLPLPDARSSIIDQDNFFILVLISVWVKLGFGKLYNFFKYIEYIAKYFWPLKTWALGGRPGCRANPD